MLVVVSKVFIMRLSLARVAAITATVVGVKLGMELGASYLITKAGVGDGLTPVAVANAAATEGVLPAPDAPADPALAC